ncbi:AbrB/MazE/SpoVT family DNA-binding domain-containing protein [Candidatus Woesearchaeota archaeon]|nr:AbrB/MazE/SpoVT family DNA-binding domain-containing protein [Candidatus Woesearchaeota archaeon]
MKVLEMRSATITAKGQIALPRHIREIEGFKEGEKIAVLAFQDHVELRSMKHFNEKMFPALASEKSLAKNWLSKEDEEAWKDL